MAGWHHQLDGRESEWTPGDGDGEGGLACCDSWGRKESDTTEWLNWTELRHIEQVWSQGLLGSLSRWSMEWHTQVWPRIYRVKGYNNLGEEICHGPLCVPLHSYWGWPWLIFTQVISQHCVYTTLEDEVMYLSGTKNRLTNCLLLKRMVN